MKEPQVLKDQGDTVSQETWKGMVFKPSATKSGWPYGVTSASSLSLSLCRTPPPPWLDPSSQQAVGLTLLFTTDADISTSGGGMEGTVSGQRAPKKLSLDPHVRLRVEKLNVVSSFVLLQGKRD